MISFEGGGLKEKDESGGLKEKDETNVESPKPTENEAELAPGDPKTTTENVFAGGPAPIESMRDDCASNPATIIDQLKHDDFSIVPVVAVDVQSVTDKNHDVAAEKADLAKANSEAVSVLDDSLIIDKQLGALGTAEGDDNCAKSK